MEPHSIEILQKELQELSTKVAQLDKDVQYLRIEVDTTKKDNKYSDAEIYKMIKALDNKIEKHVNVEEEYHKKQVEIRQQDTLLLQTLTQNLEEVKNMSYKTLSYVEAVDVAQKPIVTAWNTLSGWAAINKIIIEVTKNYIIPAVIGILAASAYFIK